MTEAATNFVGICLIVSALSALVGVSLILFSYIPHANGLRGYTSRIALIGAGMLLTGIGSLFLGWLDPPDAGVSATRVILSGLLALPMSIGVISGYFLPAIIAFQEKRTKKKVILIVNFFAFVTLVWLVTFIWACTPEKVPRDTRDIT